MSLTSYLAAPSRDFLLLPEWVQGDFNKNADGSQAFSAIIGEKRGCFKSAGGRDGAQRAKSGYFGDGSIRIHSNKEV